MNFQTLRVQTYGDTEQENIQVTLSPGNIKMVLAFGNEMRQGKYVRKVSVVFLDNEAVELYLMDHDLMRIEDVVGGYSIE